MLDMLSTGATGVVFSAYDPELDRKVAVKLISRRLAVDPHERRGWGCSWGNLETRAATSLGNCTDIDCVVDRLQTAPASLGSPALRSGRNLGAAGRRTPTVVLAHSPAAARPATNRLIR